MNMNKYKKIKYIFNILLLILVNSVIVYAGDGLRLLTTSFKHPDLAKWAAENPTVIQENFTRQDFVNIEEGLDYSTVKQFADKLADENGILTFEIIRPIFFESLKDGELEFQKKYYNKVRNIIEYQGSFTLFSWHYKNGNIKELNVYYHKKTDAIEAFEVKKEKIINLVSNEIFQDFKVNSPKLADTYGLERVERALLGFLSVEAIFFTDIDDSPALQNPKLRTEKVYLFTEHGNFIKETKGAIANITFLGKEWFNACQKIIDFDKGEIYDLFLPERITKFMILKSDMDKIRTLYQESSKIVDVFDPIDNKIVKAITERWGLIYIENHKLVLQEIDKSFNNYVVKPTFINEYNNKRVQGANGISNLDYYKDNNHDYMGTWHTHPDFQSLQPKGSCDIEYGFGYPSGDGTCNYWGSGDVQAMDNVADIDDWPKQWQLRGAIGLIPSSKGLTIFRHDGVF